MAIGEHVDGPGGQPFVVADTGGFAVSRYATRKYLKELIEVNNSTAIAPGGKIPAN